MDWPTLYILSAIFLATVIRSGFGFGEALIAVPLLALVMPVEAATPLAVLISIVVAGVVLLQDWRKVHFRSAMGLFVATLFGIPLGLWMLTALEERVVKTILGGTIIAFSSYCLFSRSRLFLPDDRFGWIFGFFAGILGGAYGMNGPPLVVFGSLRRWTPEHFRATLQAYFLPASIVGLAGYRLSGVWDHDVTFNFFASLPAALLAILLGRWINRRIKAGTFLVYVHAGLVLIGSYLVINSNWNAVVLAHQEQRKEQDGPLRQQLLGADERACRLR